MLTPRRITLLIAGCALALAACGKADPVPTSQTGSPEPTSSQSPAQSPSPSAAPVAGQVLKPWKPGERELGVNVLWEDNQADTDEITEKKTHRMLDHLVDLHVNSVALNIPFAMDGWSGSTITAHPKYTPLTQRLAIFLKEAERRKMRVTLRPLLDERTLIDRWRGIIHPTDRDKWFDTYTKFLVPYAETAAKHGVEEIAVGVEFNSLQSDPRWAALVTQVRSVFPGKLSYAANYDTYEAKTPSPPVDSVTVDAYFPVDQPDDASVKALTSEWESWIDEHAGAEANKLVVSEAGIAAENDAHAEPSHWGNVKPLNLELQRRWYEAVCQATESRSLAGIYFWMIRMHHNPGSENPAQHDRLTFVDRPAESVIEDCFAKMSGAQ